MFLDVSQAFDRVWHPGLLHKLKINLPANIYAMSESYLDNRHFLVKQQDTWSDLTPIRAGVPQGSILGPVLYLLYTADIPTTPDTMIQQQHTLMTQSFLHHMKFLI